MVLPVHTPHFHQVVVGMFVLRGCRCYCSNLQLRLVDEVELVSHFEYRVLLGWEVMFVDLCVVVVVDMFLPFYMLFPVVLFVCVCGVLGSFGMLVFTL